jgi:hypothetical protein
MKKHIILITLMIIPFLLLAQDVKWGRFNTTTKSFDITTFTTSEINSDYGARIASGTSFHQGIDYLNIGSQAGDAAAAIFSGTVTLISGTVTEPNCDLKSVSVYNTTQNVTINYMHLFPCEDHTSSDGEFVFLNEQGHNIILNLGTGKAISATSNITFIHDKTTYVTTDQVNQYEMIGPIGNSLGLVKGAPQVPKHLHIAMLEGDLAVKGGRDQFKSVDLWNKVNYQATTLNTSIRTRKQDNFSRNICDEDKGADNWGAINISYADSSRNIIELRVEMNNATPFDEDKYTNVCMDEDLMEVFIASTKDYTNNTFNDFTHIKGGNYLSYFRIDPEGNENIYPSRIYDKDPLGLPKDPYGNLTSKETGIVPFAYRSNKQNISINTNVTGSYSIDFNTYPDGHPEDFYLFPDFYTRIGKNDKFIYEKNSGAVNYLADNPANGRYMDGNYKIFGRTTNIKGAQTSTAEINFTIDNFMPFIEKLYLYSSEKKAIATSKIGKVWILKK